MKTAAPLPFPEAEVRAAAERSLAVVGEAQALRIVTADDYQAAGLFLRDRTKPLLAEADRIFDPIIRAAHDSHKAALAAKRSVTDPISQADALVRKAMNAYSSEQLRRQREEEERLAAERRKAEAAAWALRERERIAAEEAASRKLAEAKAAGDAEAAGDAFAALLDAPEAAPVPEAAAPVSVSASAVTPRLDGVSTREVWRWEVLDEAAIRPAFLIPNEAAIGALVRSEKAAAAGIVGGIRVWAETSTVVR